MLSFTKEDQAKDTLAYISDFDNINKPQWNLEFDEQFSHLEKRNVRLFLPIRNPKPMKVESKRNTTSQLSQRGRTILVPSKVSLENQEVKKKQSQQKFIKNTKENLKPHKTIRNFYSLSKKAEEKQSEQGIDYMQYWIKHRFEKGSITTLIDKLKEKRTSALRL